MGQLSIAYKPSYAGGEAWQRQLVVLRAAVEHLGRKEVAFEIDVSGSALSDALNERDRKRWAAEWSHVIKAMLDQRADEVSQKLKLQLVEIDAVTASLVVSEPVDLTPEELAAGFERELKALGADGKAAIDRVRKRGRR